ncbi:hypothetical protein UFOVP29_229 [uncultured Caudovirales phage]|uniref:Uncharacterized protein n=1 Tax=uncultured Caudovirales phage TaxID=2100421 RepID=A0A6J5KSR7_9CAUD|nr:hypothetical protein UFOVP29_229 [uncultured Caudovirales phage]
MTVDIKFRRDLFGLTISVVTAEATHNLEPIEESTLDRRWRQRFHGDTWLFRNPKCSNQDLDILVKSLDNLGGNWNLKLVPNHKRDDFYAVLRMGDFNDAQMWGWGGVSNWQKWSEKEETDYQREQTQQKAPKLSKDGKSVRVKVSVEQLGDDDPF